MAFPESSLESKLIPNWCSHRILIFNFLLLPMPIPTFDHNQVLPPFVGDVTQAANMSPYRASMLEVAQRFATSPERVAILCGLIALRADLHSLGFAHGFQWLDGSFSEDVEKIRGTPPGDIDVVTFYYPVTIPSGADPAKIARVIDHGATKGYYRVDHYLVPLAPPPENIVEGTRFYFGLFSHQKQTAIWKGMVQVDLIAVQDDLDASNHLNGLHFP